jgi:hypothetical protein
MHLDPDALTDEQWAERVQEAQYYLNELSKRIGGQLSQSLSSQNQ